MWRPIIPRRQFRLRQPDKKVPGSALVPKAILRQGLIYYNSDQGNKSLERLKKVVSDYPNTPEAKQAVSTARLVYKDLNRVDEYAAWVQNVDFVEVTDADLDNTTYQAAENQYLNNNTQTAINGFEKYLKQFPNGIHSINSNFYLAQFYLCREGNKDVPHYKYIVERPTSEFTEQALARLSQIYLERDNYRDAVPLLERLEKEADRDQNIVFAQSNLMKSHYELGNFGKAEVYAEKVLNNPSSEKEARTDAR